MPADDVTADALTRRSLLGGAAAAGLAATVPGLRTDPAQAASPAATRQNVLVVVIDSLRTDHVGAYGGGRARTPNLDRLARQSLAFTQARHEAMPTVPVRKSLLIGRSGYPFRGWKPVPTLTDVPGWEGIERGERTFLDVVGRRGYLTGYVTDNPHILRPAFAGLRRRPDVMTAVPGQIPGWRLRRRKVPGRRLRRHLPPELHGLGRGRVREYLAYNGPGRDGDDYLAARVFDGGIDFVERAARASRPFALVVDCFDVHEPWDPPERHLARYARVKRGGYRPIQPFATPAGRAGDLSKHTLRMMRALYAAEVSFLDERLGRLLDRLDALGQAADTWVVVVSDHGVSLGEHGIVGKKSDELHGNLIDVPFMIRSPSGAGAGRRSGYFASSHDIAPTLLRAVGAPVPKAMDGTDLRPALRGRPPRERRSTWASAWGDTLMAGDGRWVLFATNENGRPRHPRLHDTRRDPKERRDLARSNPKVVRRLLAAMRRHAGKRGFPRL